MPSPTLTPTAPSDDFEVLGPADHAGEDYEVIGPADHVPAPQLPITKAAAEATARPDLRTQIEVRNAEQRAAQLIGSAPPKREEVASQLGGIGDPREPINVAAALTSGLLPTTTPQTERTLRNTYGQVAGGALGGIQNTASAFSSPSNLALGAGIGMAPKIVGRLAATVFSSDMLSSVYRQSPQLVELLVAGQWGDASQLATQLGLTSIAAIAAAKHAKLGDEPKPPPPKPVEPTVDVPSQAAVKAKLAIPPGASDALKTKIEVQTATQEIAQRMQQGIASVDEQKAVQDPLQGGPDWSPFGLSEEELNKTRPPSGTMADQVEAALRAQREKQTGLVVSPAGDEVVPNKPVDPTLEQGVKEKLVRMGADPEDPQSIANVLADAKGIPRPDVTVDPKLAVSQTEGDQISVPVDAPATAIVHEMEHAGEKAGANPPPPEGDQSTTAAGFMFGQEPPRDMVLAEKHLPGFSEWAETPAGAVDYKPEFVKQLGERLSDLRDMVAPTVGVSDKVMDTMGKARGPELQAEFLMAHNAILKAARAKFRGLSSQENVAFIDRMKANIDQPTPELQEIAKFYKSVMDSYHERADAVKELAYRGSPGEYADDPEAEGYFRAIWDGRWTGGAPEVGMYEKFKPDVETRKPGGDQGFFKQASGLPMQTLIDMGYIPRTWDAAEMLKLGIASKARFIGLGESMLSAFEKKGIVKVQRGEAPPAGFEPWEHPQLTRFADSIKAAQRFPQEAVEHGDYWIDPQLENLLGNYYSKNWIRATQPASTLLALKGFTTAQELMFALPHLQNTTMATSAMEIASGLTELYNQGIRGVDADNIPPLKFQIGKSEVEVTGRQAALARGAAKVMEGMLPAVSAGRYIEKSGRIYRVLSTPEEFWTRADAKYMADNPYMKEAAEVLFESGGHIPWDETQTQDLMQQSKDAWRNDQNGRSIAKILGWGGELPGRVLGSRAIFSAISRMKATAYFETYVSLRAKYAEEVATGQMSKGRVGRMAWDHVDNVYGMIDYTRTWFWNRTFGSTVMGLVRAPGWTIGGLQSVGRGAIEGAKDLAAPLKLIGSGDEGLNVKNATPDLDIRTAWPIAYLLPMAAMATVYQLAKTGTTPQEPLDIAYPKSGGVNDRGHANRRSVFGYGPDWYNWAHHPGTTAWHKMAGILSRTGESLQNRDYYGQRIYDPTADSSTKFLLGAGHVVLPSPFAYAGVKQTMQEDEGKPTAEQIQDQLLTLTGNKPAPSSLENTSAEDVMDKIFVAKRAEQGIEADVFDDRQKMRQWVRKIREGGKEAQQGVINDIVAAGGGNRIVAGVLKRAQMPPEDSLFSMLTWKEANQVWDHTSDAEKKRWTPIFLQKLGRVDPSKSNYPAREQKLLQEAQAKLGLQPNSVSE